MNSSLAQQTQADIKKLACKIVSVSKDQKTAKVHVSRTVSSSKYSKLLHRYSTYLVDCSGVKEVKPGSIATIVPVSRISKRKAWKLVEST